MTNVFDASRRSFLIGATGFAALALAGCTSSGNRAASGGVFGPRNRQTDEPTFSQYYLDMYRAMPEERFPIPAVNLRQLKETHFRQMVPDPTGERPGTIVVDTASRYLYLVLDGGQAMRYGVGIGRDGFTWSGRGYIAYKREWPVWTPPSDMIKRQPELEEYRNGMQPGLDNPLGARALYIFKDGRDTIYRIHGTGEVWTIGDAVSSGCVRLLHQDVIDLYNRVPNGSPILVV